MVSENCINLIDEFKSLRGINIAIFATYSFDPIFFEHIILRSLRKNNPLHKVIVLVDSEHYPKISEMTFSTGIDYLLLPVTGRLFHPKIFLFLSEKEGVAYIGSHNLTFSGITHNLELDYKTKENEIVFDCLTFFIDLLSKMFEKSSVVNQLQISRETFRIDTIKRDTYFLHNLKEPILKTALDIVSKSGKFRKAIVFAPFFSNEVDLINQILNKKIELIDICIQRKNHNLNVEKVTEISSVTLKELVSDRMIHSKFIIFQGQKEYALIGSPNFTDPALNKTIEKGNCETAILLDLNIIGSVFNQISLIDIAKSEAINTLRLERPILDQFQTYQLTIRMATIDALNQLIIHYDKINEDMNLQLALGYINNKQILQSKQGKLHIYLEAKSTTKIVFIGKREDSILWLENLQNTRISNYIRIYRSSSLEHYYGIKTDAETLPSILSNVKNIENLFYLIQVLLPQSENYKTSSNNSSTLIRDPAPGKMPSNAKIETIYDVLLDLIRQHGQKKSESLSYSIKPKPVIDSEPEETDFDYNLDYKHFEKIFDKWTIAFEQKKLSLENSLLNYWLYLLISIKLYDFLPIIDKNRPSFLSRLETIFISFFNKYGFSAKASKEVLLFSSLLAYIENETVTQSQLKEIFRKIVFETNSENLHNFDSETIFETWAKLDLTPTNNYVEIILKRTCLLMVVFKILKEGEQNTSFYCHYMVSEIASPDITDIDALFISEILRELYLNLNLNDKKILQQDIEKALSQKTLRFPRRFMFSDVIKK